MSPYCENNCVKLTLQLFQGNVAANSRIELEGDPKRRYLPYFFLQHLPGEAVLGNANGEHSPGRD